MKLPDETDFAVTKIGGAIPGERIQLQLRAVYVTGGSAIKRAQDVQQGTLAGARLADNGQHLALVHLKRQVIKEQQVRIA